jgi:hypothetical protein
MAIKTITQLPEIPSAKDIKPMFTFDETVDNLARVVNAHRENILDDQRQHVIMEYLYSLACELKKR